MRWRHTRFWQFLQMNITRLVSLLSLSRCNWSVIFANCYSFDADKRGFFCLAAWNLDGSKRISIVSDASTFSSLIFFSHYLHHLMSDEKLDFTINYCKFPRQILPMDKHTQNIFLIAHTEGSWWLWNGWQYIWLGWGVEVVNFLLNWKEEITIENWNADFTYHLVFHCNLFQNIWQGRRTEKDINNVNSVWIFIKSRDRIHLESSKSKSTQKFEFTFCLFTSHWPFVNVIYSHWFREGFWIIEYLSQLFCHSKFKLYRQFEYQIRHVILDLVAWVARYFIELAGIHFPGEVCVEFSEYVFGVEWFRGTDLVSWAFLGNNSERGSVNVMDDIGFNRHSELDDFSDDGAFEYCSGSDIISLFFLQ